MNVTRPMIGRIRPVVAACEEPGDDGAFLVRFVEDRDQAAFEVLVRRLGPMVLGACRRFLGPGPDADDAFQATFVVLARKASEVRPPSRVAAWVYGVACLAARKARAGRDRRRLTEVLMSAVPDTPSPAVRIDSELGAVLDAELEALPEKYRLPIVLCELRELTIDQAAGHLGIRPGTVASRLSRGRRLLADRLVRRGFAGGLAVALATQSARAAVSARLFKETVRAVGGTPAVSESVLALTSEVLRSMTGSKLTIVATGVALTVVGVLGVFAPHATLLPQVAAAPAPASPAQDPLDRIRIHGLNPLITSDLIQKKLGVTDEQLQKFEDFRKETGACPPPQPPQPQKVAAGGVMMVGRLQTFDPVAEGKFDKAAANVLTPEQTRRLKQIVLQARGPEAFLDRHVIRNLGISTGQEDAIEAALPSAANARPGAPERDPEAEKTAMEVIRRVLTPEQWGRWEKLVGEAIPHSEQVQVPTPGTKSNFPKMVNQLVPVVGGGALPIVAPPGNPGGLLPVPPPPAAKPMQ